MSLIINNGFVKLDIGYCHTLISLSATKIMDLNIMVTLRLKIVLKCVFLSKTIS